MLKPSKNKNWPSGNYRDIAAIDVSDQEIVNLAKQQLSEGIEIGLGSWVAVGGELLSGQPVEIICYKESPTPNHYIIRIDSSANVKVIASQIFAELNVDPSSIKWQCSELQNT